MRAPTMANGIARGRMLRNEPMARHSTWRAGGLAERLYEPADLADLCAFLRALPLEELITWVGLGSNLLVRDGGVCGTVILVAGALSEVRRADDRLDCGAGASCARVARAAAGAGLAGAEFLIGIPGTVGGALAMNAGAEGVEIWQIVERAQVVDRAGELHTRSPADYAIAYRSVGTDREEWFVAASLRLRAADPDACRSRIRELLDRRAASQPVGKPSCGSVFRNPPGDYAGRLIEAAGLKGLREGGCHVSTKHANFIINDGHATATDIETLLHRVQAAVRDATGIELQPEVRIIGCREGLTDGR